MRGGVAEPCGGRDPVLSPAWLLTGLDEPLGLGDCADGGAVGRLLAVPRGGLGCCVAAALPWPGPGLLQPPFSVLVPLVWVGDGPTHAPKGHHRPHSTYARAHGAHRWGGGQLVSNTEDTGGKGPLWE